MDSAPDTQQASDATSQNPDNMTFVSPGINVHTFTDKVLDNGVFFQVTKLCQSFHLWIGKSGSFGEMSVAMKTIVDMPSCSALIGGGQASGSMAQRLSKRTGKQVFVSGDMSAFSQLELPLIEKRIAQEMKDFPDKF